MQSRLSRDLAHQYLAINEDHLEQTFFVEKAAHLISSHWLNGRLRKSLSTCTSWKPIWPALNFTHIRSSMWSKVPLVFLPTAIGNPRYHSLKDCLYRAFVSHEYVRMQAYLNWENCALVPVNTLPWTLSIDHVNFIESRHTLHIGIDENEAIIRK